MQRLVRCCDFRGRHVFGSSDAPLADQRSVMVAETGLKCTMMAKPPSGPGQHYVQSSPLLLILLLSLYLCALPAQTTNASITGR